MNKYEVIKIAFEGSADSENAIKMSKYMRDMFDFYGLPTPKRREVYSNFLKDEKKNKMIDWEFLDKCYLDNHREFQYLVYDYLLAMKQYLTYDDITKIKNFIVTKSWWDTIDFLCKVIGFIGLKDKRVKDLMLDWSISDNIWIKRTAIEHQLCLKEKTDTKLLEQIIVNCFGSDEFFINKAIGWALRDYSKTNPEWVKDFVHKYNDKMDSLSIKEASKYI
ncbi:MAG: DNA alkylation repair protein [Blautia sp.]|nr:DNA alkylation repair protein [Blautia sp.]